MSKFWAGYFLGRGNGGGGTVPPGLVYVAIIFGVIMGAMFLLAKAIQFVGSLSRAHPFLTVLVVGTVSALLGELLGTDEQMDVSAKVLGTGVFALAGTAVFSIIMFLTGSASFDELAGAPKVVAALLSLVIVGSFAYMLWSLFNARARTSTGRRVRVAAIVLLGSGTWNFLFSVDFPSIPVFGSDLIFLAGLALALYFGYREPDPRPTDEGEGSMTAAGS